MATQTVKRYDLENRLKSAQADRADIRSVIATWGKNHAYAAPVYAALQIAEQRIDNLILAMSREDI